MKVALLHYDFKPYTTGLANGLADKAEIIVIHPEKASADCDSALDPRIKIYNFKKPQTRNPQNLSVVRNLFKYIRDLHPDVLHVQATCDPWFDTATFYDQLPPMVTTIHDVFPHPGDQSRVPGSVYTGRIPYYRSKHLIVHADLLKEQLLKHFGRSAEKVSVLQHGEIGSYYKHWSDGTSIEREPYTLLFFGRIWPYKGLRYLIEAMPIVAQQIPQVKLIIAGRGEDLEQHFPDGIDLNRYEILNRYIAQSEVVSLFQRSAVTILPYIEASQSGVAALAYGLDTPVIASQIGGLTEMVRHEQDGLLVPAGNPQALAESIIRLLKDKDLQFQLQTGARKRCQTDLNWSHIGTETLKVYQKVLENR